MQPVLIKKAITFVTESQTQPASIESKTLISAAVGIYMGLAIITAQYNQSLNRLRIRTRSALIALVEQQTMRSWADSSLEGRVATLISNDVDALETILEMAHETWAQTLEVVVGFFLLSREVGWLWPVPLVMIFVCSRVSQFVARTLRAKQGSWNAATQDRISLTSSMISNIKSIKMLGMQSSMVQYIEKSRLHELKMASKVRWLMVAYNASANALGMFAPVVTIVLYAVLTRRHGNQRLDTEVAFTAVAILGMVTHPANMVMTIVPRIVASFASFERIQEFLTQECRVDKREPTDDDFENAVSITNLSIGNPEAILSHLNLDVQRGTFVAVMGSTGSGKSLLAKAIAGETDAGPDCSIRLSTVGVAYCSQNAWLPNRSVKGVITQYGSQMINGEDWYRKVLRACCLEDDLAMLSAGDLTKVGPRGMNLSGGQRQRVALARAAFARAKLLVLDDPFSALDGKTEGQVVSNLLGPEGIFRALGTTVILFSHATQHFHLVDNVYEIKAGQLLRTERWSATIRHDGKGPLRTNAQRDVDEASDAVPAVAGSLQPQAIKFTEAMKPSWQNGDASLYAFYVEAAGYKNFLFMASCSAIYSFFITFPQYWLKMWTDTTQNDDAPFVLGYASLVLAAWLTTNAMMWSTVIHIAPHSGRTLHSKLLSIVSEAPLSYFHTNGSGSILNRFTQDIQLVDKQLPSAVSALAVQISKLTMQAVLLFVAQRLLMVTFPICMIVVYFVQKLYLRTSRQLRLLELESKATVLAAFMETVDGLCTIRAFDGAQESTVHHLHQLDESHKPLYMLLCLQRWLNLVLDLLVAGIAVGVIALAVLFRSSTTGGEIGMALNLVLVANTTLVRLVESWTSLEISLGAIARLKSLESDVPPEREPSEKLVPPETWPSAGSLELRNVTASYNTENDALCQVQLAIEPGKKVVLCGRTGSGKSSLLLTLLRLIHVKHGTITVDSIDIGRVPRSILRQRCFVTIPQDAILLSQPSLRFNLDPTESLSDETLLTALSKVRLRDHLALHEVRANASAAGGSEQARLMLERPLSALPALSVGQGQLLALARALLHVYRINTTGAKPIVLLDEATSSLDAQTEELILGIIHGELTLQGFTVIMVAHRVKAAAAYMREEDVVVWMQDGEVVKRGSRGDMTS
ncbi:ABC transporter-like protein [Microdochium trichocladiopsis]|uniref:ABC transporter-like protein n=1 Tax=Microdochium trichocladiopsis TaxID=1682393 RepID=A0A9P9BSE2_9PEZI|nr:ABC transporter-like protein [Microdochium trichocladiopsis]KAH7034680.1 ABC transporter-like protein [Microdochium trichocladiopsis]